jgi:hypothetical protein
VKARPPVMLRSGHAIGPPGAALLAGRCRLADREREKPAAIGKRLTMSRFIVQEPGPYLLWAGAPTGRKIQILINGADVGIVRESYVGPWSQRDIDAERDLATGVAVTTMPEDARLIDGAFPHVNRHIHGLDHYINCGTQVDDSTSTGSRWEWSCSVSPTSRTSSAWNDTAAASPSACGPAWYSACSPSTPPSGPTGRSARPSSAPSSATTH